MGRKKKENPCSKSKDECMKKKHKKNKIVIDNNKSDVYHISEDLIIEILLRLPPPSVVRFKQVSKTWYTLITNPDFLRTHSSSLQCHKRISTTTTTDDHDHEELIVSSYNSRGRSLQLQSNQLLKLFPCPSKFNRKLIDSCNGLILLRCQDSERSDSYDYYVCNPIIKQLLKIPSDRITENFKSWQAPDPYILFDPSISLSYKLIRYFARMDKNVNTIRQISVYSSEIGSWRHLISFPSWSWSHLTTAVLLNGIFYWKEIYNGDRLVCFDLKEENVWFLPLPPNPIRYSERVCFYFGECDGRLRLIEKYVVSTISLGQRRSHLTIPCSFDIMETEPQQQQHQQDSNQLTWSVKYHVNINTGFAKNHPSTFRIIQLYKTKNEEEEDALLLNIHGTIVSFNLKNNTFGKKLRIDQNPLVFNDLSDFSNVFLYIKTTLLPLLG